MTCWTCLLLCFSCFLACTYALLSSSCYYLVSVPYPVSLASYLFCFVLVVVMLFLFYFTTTYCFYAHMRYSLLFFWFVLPTLFVLLLFFLSFFFLVLLLCFLLCGSVFYDPHIASSRHYALLELLFAVVAEILDVLEISTPNTTCNATTDVEGKRDRE